MDYQSVIDTLVGFMGVSCPRSLPAALQAVYSMPLSAW